MGPHNTLDYLFSTGQVNRGNEMTKKHPGRVLRVAGLMNLKIPDPRPDERRLVAHQVCHCRVGDEHTATVGGMQRGLLTGSGDEVGGAVERDATIRRTRTGVRTVRGGGGP